MFLASCAMGFNFELLNGQRRNALKDHDRWDIEFTASTSPQENESQKSLLCNMWGSFSSAVAAAAVTGGCLVLACEA